MGSGNKMQRGYFLMKRGGLWFVVLLWFWRTEEGDKDRFKMGKPPEGRDRLAQATAVALDRNAKPSAGASE